MGIDRDNIKLVRSEDVIVEQKGEFMPDDHVVNILMRGHKNMLNMFDNLGFKGFEFVHPRHGYKVHFFAKENIVAMIDYHGSNTLNIEILNKEERDWFFESVEEYLGPDEADKLRAKGDVKHEK